MNNIDTLWKLFKTSGDVRYFNLIKKIEGSKDGNNKDRRDSSRGN